jgi:hypothetical protein
MDFSLTHSPPTSGSAIYVVGDKKNDHGLYTVSLDNGTEQVFNGVSGCGGAFGQTCEQQQPTLAYFASNLAQGEHSLKISNLAGVNQSYFGMRSFIGIIILLALNVLCYLDLDSIVLTIPSSYAPRILTNGSDSGSPTSSSSSGSSGMDGMNGTLKSPAYSFSFFPLLIFSIAWLLKL